ncbi:hypothetical protein ABT369_56350 [Dactylosporangium sp. NPDC000244]|uniref:hypothetical protein n=1 Tax=Dactylosporangium sp. NPDC000244 TaxID=3154365 RepID=UPI0033228910
MLATNYRDLARKHIRAAMRWSPRLGARNRMTEQDALLLDRGIGAIFAIVGALLVMRAVSDILTAAGQ